MPEVSTTVLMTVNERQIKTAPFRQGPHKLMLCVAAIGTRPNTWDPKATKDAAEPAITFIVVSADDYDAKKTSRDVRKCEVVCGASFGHPKSGLTRFVNEVVGRKLAGDDARRLNLAALAATRPRFVGMLRVDEDSYGNTVNQLVGIVDDGRKPLDVSTFLLDPSQLPAVREEYDPFADV